MSLPTNYILGAGTELENFDTIGDWGKGGGDGAGTVTEDTTHVRTSTASIRLTVNTVSSNVSANKATNFTLNSNATINFWVWIPHESPRDKIDHLQITLSNDAESTKYFQSTSYFGYGFRPFVSGWNNVSIHVSEFSATGAASWNDPIVKIIFRIYARTNETCYMVFDKMWFDQESETRAVLTFDDCFETVHTNAYPYMAAAKNAGKSGGMPGTLYPCKSIIQAGTGAAGAAMTTAHIKALYDAGWAVGNHSATHPDMSSYTAAQVLSELQIADTWLASLGLDRCRKHVAIPYGYPITFNMLQALEDFGAETMRSSYPRPQSAEMGNPLLLRARGVDQADSVDTVIGHFEEALLNGQSLIMYFHSIADTVDTNYWPIANFQGLIDYLEWRKIQCVTIDEWYEGLTNPRYRSMPISR